MEQWWMLPNNILRSLAIHTKKVKESAGNYCYHSYLGELKPEQASSVNSLDGCYPTKADSETSISTQNQHLLTTNYSVYSIENTESHTP